jgi:hypothetical protein
MTSVLWADELIHSDRRTGINRLWSTLSIGKDSVMRTVEELVCSKVSARWAPRVLSDVRKQAMQAVIVDLLRRYDVEVRASLCRFSPGRYLSTPFRTQIPVAAMEGMAPHITKEKESEQCSVSRSSRGSSPLRKILVNFWLKVTNSEL